MYVYIVSYKVQSRHIKDESVPYKNIFKWQNQPYNVVLVVMLCLYFSQALSKKARDGKMLPEEYQGGSFR